MDILFVTPTEKLKLNSVSNGTMLLGTILLEAGFSVDIVRFGQFSSYGQQYDQFITEITNHILEINPKCVSFYTLWPYYHISLRIAKEIKCRNKNIITVFGGPQSSATAEETLKTFSDIDYISTGEGENTVVPFFTEILKNNCVNLADIPGLVYRQGDEIIHNTQEISLCDLNTLPYWDDRLIHTWNPLDESDLHSSEYYMPIDAGRGCPYSCTFCSTSNFWRRTYRLKSAERIVDELKYYNQKYGIKSFSFSHDAFTSNKKLVAEVCDKIIEEGLKITWFCSTRIDCLNEELVLKMIKAGLTSMSVGVETGSPRMQKIINKRLNLERSKEMITFLHKNNLKITVFFMYGFPEETEEDLNQTLEMIFDLLDQGIKRTTLSFCHFSPATQMTIDNFDNLVLDANNKISFRGIFGYKKEMEMLKSNKKIFSVFYNLPTDLRINYQNLFYFKYIYDKYRLTLSFLRRYYRGDNLAFYRMFNNQIVEFLNKDNLKNDMIKNGVVEIINNTISRFDKPFKKQLNGLFSFEYDINTIKQSKTDCSIKKVYDFAYLDYLTKTPLENFSEYKSELLIQKKNGRFNIEIINITPFTEA